MVISISTITGTGTGTLVYLPSATADKGIYSLIAPDGSEWYKNPGYDTDSFTSPDFALTNTPVTKPMPLDMYGQIKQTDASTYYTVNLKVESDPTPQVFRFKYSKVIFVPTINTPVQDCTTNSTTITYNANFPVWTAYTETGRTWYITDPNGTTTTQTTATCTLSPLVSGTYQIRLVIAYSYVDSTGPSEAFVYSTVETTANYVNTCGNSLSLLCKANCFLGKALAANATNQIVQLSGLMSYIWGNIQCGNQTASQPMFDLVMTRLQLDPAHCDCGGCD